LLCLLLSGPAVHGADRRLVYTGETYPWLAAVGRLSVPGERRVEGRYSYFLEDCSATLVARPAAAHADTIITAWHCLEHYRDLSRPITFRLGETPGKILEMEATRVADGGGMHADWAILRLREPVPASHTPALPVGAQGADRGAPVIMAGFSRDEGLGRGGEVLTYDPGCRITGQVRRSADTDCTAHKGSSGGAVVQVSGSGEARLCGVISEGDGSGYSRFVPVGAFRGVIELHL